MSQSSVYRVCRTCLQEIKDSAFFPLDSTLVYKLNNLVPNLNLAMVSNSVICSKCVHEINSALEFKNKCLRTEARIHQYLQQQLNSASPLKQSPNSGPVVIDSESDDDVQLIEPDGWKDSSASSCGARISSDTNNVQIPSNNGYSQQVTSIPVGREYVPNLQVIQTESMIFNTDKCSQNNVNSNLDENLFCCTYCSYKSNNRDHLNVHMLVHIQTTQFKCVCCDYLTDNVGSLKVHFKSHTTETLFERIYNNYNQNQGLNGGETERVGPNTEKLFACNQCQYTSVKLADLNYHMRTHGPTAKEVLTCILCDYKTEHTQALQQHLMTHAYKCKYCPYKAIEMDSLTVHMRTHTGKKLVYTCTLCKYSSTQKMHVNVHMKSHMKGSLRQRYKM